MSRNRKQSNRAAAAVNKKTEADALKENLNEVKSSVKEKVEELKKDAEVKISRVEQSKSNQSKVTPTEKKATVNNKAEATATKAVESPAKEKVDALKKDAETKIAQAEQAKANPSKKQQNEATKASDKPKVSSEPKKTEATSNNKVPPKKTAPKQQVLKNKQQINYAPAEKSAGGGGKLLAGLALLLGVAGTGLGAYSFNELRTLKAGVSQGVDAKLSSLDGKIAELAKVDPAAAVKGKLDELNNQQQALKTAESRFNERIAAVEQMQKGLSQSVKSEIDTALAAKLAAVDSLLEKVKDIELGQQGLSKNLSEASAASRAISAKGMEKQEVGYLLRMANYKLQSEADVVGATGLLKLAESKLLAANEGKADAMVDAVREKVIQLSGVKAVDTNALLGQLKSISRDITKLQPKVTDTATTPVATTEQGATSNGVLDKITAVIASGVKYTPKDPSKIDISAETILIEKRLMQADVKTAELAVQSHNKVMLAESVKAISDSLGKFFAADDTAKSIDKTLTTIAQSELETVMPNLSGLVKQFESTQVQ